MLARLPLQILALICSITSWYHYFATVVFSSEKEFDVKLVLSHLIRWFYAVYRTCGFENNLLGWRMVLKFDFQMIWTPTVNWKLKVRFCFALVIISNFPNFCHFSFEFFAILYFVTFCIQQWNYILHTRHQRIVIWWCYPYIKSVLY